MASGLVKWALGNLEKSSTYQKFIIPKTVKNIMKKRVQEYDCRDLPVIPNPKVEKTLESSFNNKYGGIHVLVAPTGSGKSTYMRSYANRFMADGGFVQYFSSELQNRKMFFTQFGDESRASDLLLVKQFHWELSNLEYSVHSF